MKKGLETVEKCAESNIRLLQEPDSLSEKQNLGLGSGSCLPEDYRHRRSHPVLHSIFLSTGFSSFRFSFQFIETFLFNCNN